MEWQAGRAVHVSQCVHMGGGDEERVREVGEAEGDEGGCGCGEKVRVVRALKLV